MKLPFSVLVVALTFSFTCLLPGQKETPSPAPVASPSKDGKGVTPTAGFHKEEALGDVAYHWVRQHSVLRLEVPTAGNYRLLFKPITVFSPKPVTITVSVNGEKSGTISASGSDFAKASVTSVNATLRAGANEITLDSDRLDSPLSTSDDRPASYGMVMPVVAEPAP